MIHQPTHQLCDDLEFDEPELRRLCDHLRSMAADGGLPSRKEFDLLDWPNLVSSIMILDRDKEAGDWRVRFYGPELAQVYGIDATGRLLSDDLYSADGRFQSSIRIIRKLIGAAETRRGPVRAIGTVSVPDREFFSYELLYAPMADDDGMIGHILIGASYKMGIATE